MKEVQQTKAPLLFGFTKPHIISELVITWLCWMYLPDDDNVEIQLIAFLCNVVNISESFFSRHTALTLAARWCPGWCHLHSLRFCGLTALEEEISTWCGGTDNLHRHSSKRERKPLVNREQKTHTPKKILQELCWAFHNLYNIIIFSAEGHCHSFIMLATHLKNSSWNYVAKLSMHHNTTAYSICKQAISHNHK